MGMMSCQEDMDIEHDPSPEDVYQGLRPLLFSIAYGIVGSVTEAEDIVQEALLRYHREGPRQGEIESPKAWLSTVTTRLAINRVRSARVRRETYPGTWLPEPLLTDPAPDASQQAETADSPCCGRLIGLTTRATVLPPSSVFLNQRSWT